jgi:hypothetical protein
MNDMTPIQRLTKDLANAARTMTSTEARFLVDAYYIMQDARIRAEGQVRSIDKTPVEIVATEDGDDVPVHEPHGVLSWFSKQNADMEGQIKRALEKYVDSHVMGDWLTGIYGIGPVIAAGLVAHISMEWMECSVCHKKEGGLKPCKCDAPFVRKTCATAGQIHRFAGLDPTSKWEKKTKRPWNAELKVLCWKAGESFVMFHKNEKCFYGKVWAAQKAVYKERNERGDYAERSAQILLDRKFKKDTDAYKAYITGKFPPAHIHAMARRYAVKMFLSHLHGEMHRRILGTEPPLPYPIAHMGHAHFIAPPK